MQNIFLKTHQNKADGAKFLMIEYYIERRVEEKKLLYSQHIVNSHNFLDSLHYINLPRYKFIVRNMTVNNDGRFSNNGLNYKDWDGRLC